MDVGPSPEILLSIRESNLGWPSAIGELIDNAFDADAKRVVVSFQSKRLLVEDDGNGCDDAQAMLTLGKHYRQQTTKLGRYGVGLKDTACWLWGITKIGTVSKGMERKLAIDWSLLAKQDRWEIPDPWEAPSNGHLGTSLVFEKIQRSLPKDCDRLVSELSYTFTPGLLSGRQIQFCFPKRKPITAKPFSLPPLDSIIEEVFDIDGRGVRLYAGIVKQDHPNPKPGFGYCHHHRVIMNSALGAGQYSTSRIAGQVTLDNQWSLSTHKDDVTELRDELGDAVYDRCKTILCAAEKQSKTMKSAAFDSRLNERLRNAMSELVKRKEKRDPGTTHGTIVPKGTAKKRTPRKTQPGDRIMSDEQIGKLRIDWKPLSKGTMGEVDQAGSLIWMNEANEHLATLRHNENEDAILLAAIGMYVHDAVHSGFIQKYLPGIDPGIAVDGQYFSLWATILESLV